MTSPTPTDEAPLSSPDRQSLLKPRPARPRRLRLPVNLQPVYGEPSPVTPCSVFSFDLPNSPGMLTMPRIPRVQRSMSTPVEHPASPTSIFNFDLLFTSPFGSQRTLRSSTSVPQTPATPGQKPFLFPVLPTIEESRGSFSSSVEREEEQLIPCKTDWKSIYLITLVILLTRIQFTTYFASLYPFMKEIDKDFDDMFYSYITVAYSIGIAAAAPLFGKWSNKLGSIRKPTVVSMVIMIVTNLIYMFVYLSPIPARFPMLIARILTGIAAGGNALLPTYWTYSAGLEDRSTAAALFDGALALGLAFGPGFQLILAKLTNNFPSLNYPGFLLGPFQFSMYTIPAMISIVLILVALILMLFFFDEVPMPKKEKRNSIDSSTSSETSGPLLPPYDRLAVFFCIAAKMVQMFVYACMETIGPMYISKMFNLENSEITKFNSSLVSLSGVLGFLFLLAYVCTKTGKRVDNRVGVLIGILVCVGFVVSTYSWPFYPDFIGNCKDEPWCASTQRIPQWLYAVSYTIVFGVGFALINVHLAALYSSVLGPRRQGTMHGLNTLMASFSRVLGPLVVTDLYSCFGPKIIWIFMLFVWLLLGLSLLASYRRLVPCCVPAEEEGKSSK